MKRIRNIAVALLAALALSAVATSGAQALTAPFWSIGGSRLVAGKTHNFDARAFNKGNFTWNVPLLGIKITCTAFAIEKGVLLGSNEGEPGRDDEIMVFSGCSLTEGNGAPGCALKETTLKTAPLKSELVENVVDGEGGKQLLEEVFPATGNEFLRVVYTGKECLEDEGVFRGKGNGEILTDNGLNEKVELGAAKKEGTSWLLKFPEQAITSVWLITGGGAKEQETQFEDAGEPAALVGTALTLLAGTKFEPEPNAKWSPLP
jgi:hypothetical protein